MLRMWRRRQEFGRVERMRRQADLWMRGRRDCPFFGVWWDGISWAGTFKGEGFPRAAGCRLRGDRMDGLNQGEES